MTDQEIIESVVEATTQAWDYFNDKPMSDNIKKILVDLIGSAKDRSKKYVGRKVWVCTTRSEHPICPACSQTKTVQYINVKEAEIETEYEYGVSVKIDGSEASWFARENVYLTKEECIEAASKHEDYIKEF